MFDKQLQQHPVRLLKHLSKRFKLILSWAGKYNGNALIYATPNIRSILFAVNLKGK
ncbi:hypothetical protein [Bacillus methanolicus]|uniref:hypothetical protein n=1 Tax=Bacillus methanolicus TaxID=1471 RepID=UPI003CD049BB